MLDLDELQTVSAKEAAKMLGVHVDTLYRWVRERRHNIPALHLGRSVRFRVAALKAWMAEHEWQVCVRAAS